MLTVNVQQEPVPVLLASMWHVSPPCCLSLKILEHCKLRIAAHPLCRVFIIHPAFQAQVQPTKSEEMHRPRGGNDLRDPRAPPYRNNPGYADWVKNHILGFSYHSGLDIAMRYLIPKANLQVAAQDHAYLDKHFAEYWVDAALHNLPSSQTGQESNRREDQDYFRDIERKTREQSDNKLWHYHRKWRLTASNFGAIYHMTGRRDMENFFDGLLHPKSLCSKAVIYGKHMEQPALLKFVKSTGIQIRKCGLFVCEDFPFLAATPDAITDAGDAVVEVKCPYSCMDKLITAECLPYLEKTSSGMKLKAGSNYFCQLQGQMAITKIHKAFFVVFSSKTLFVEEVTFDRDFWDGLLAKLAVVFTQYRSFIARSL